MSLLSRVRARLLAWTDDALLRQHEDKLFFVLTILIGVMVGLAIVAFILVTEHLGSRMLGTAAPAWARLVVPTFGALLAGILLYWFFPGARGSGIPQTKTALVLENGMISLRSVLGRFGCSSLSLASGIALGREGPSVHVGAGIASLLGQRLGLTAAQTKRLLPVGAAAAIAAAFNTPIAAVLFALEEVVGDLHASVLGSVVLSAATSWMVLHLMLGDEPLFHVPAYQLVHPFEFGAHVLLGVAGGLVSVAFVKLLLGLRRRFQRLPSRTVWFQPAIGGLLVGLMGLAVPQVLGVGYGHVGDALNGRLTIGLMALLLALKLVATATAYASGNAGGIFGPSLFLGAMLGGAVGNVVHGLFPEYTGGAGAYALIGMGTAFAGIIRVPFTSVVMIFELTRDYTIIVPLMIANMVSHAISARLQPVPIYEALLQQDGVHLPPRREVSGDRADEPEARPGSARTVLVRVTVSVALMLALSGLLAYWFRADREATARRYLSDGLTLVQQHRETDAIQPLRRALAMRPGNETRLALAGALMAVDRPAEATLYFDEALKADPASGPAHLGIAQAAVRTGRRDLAVRHFERAIAADWGPQNAGRQASLRLEYADYLASQSETDLAIGQLIQLERPLAGDTTALLGVARRYLALGAIDRAASLYTRLSRVSAAPVDVFLGLGTVSLARGDLREAAAAYRSALRRDPGNTSAADQFGLCERALALDSEARRLSAAERLTRSVALLTAVVADWEACAARAPAGSAPPDEVVQAARLAAAKRVAPGQRAEAAEANAELARELWRMTRHACGAPASPSAADMLLSTRVP